MAISFIGEASAAATSVTVPVHQIGDIIVIFAFRTATTSPTLGAGYTAVNNATGNSNSFRIGYKIATATNDSSGTWTNATGVICVVYRDVRGIFAIGTNTGATKAASTTANIPTLGLTNTSGGSWVVAFAGSLQTTAQGTPLAGATTSRGTQALTGGNIGAFDTNAGVTAFAATTSSNTTSVVSSGAAVELLPVEGVALVGDGGNITTATATHTDSVTISNPNSTIIVGVQAFDGTASNTLISSVTYNGVNLTQLRALPAHGVVFPNNSVYLYAITGLAPQVANLVVTWAGVCSSPQSTWAVYANTAATVDSSIIAETDATSVFTGSVTTIADKALCWSFIVFNNNSSSAPSGVDQVQTFLITTGFNAASSSKTQKTPAGSVTHTYSNTAPDDYIIAMGSIAPPPPIGKDISPSNNTPGMIARQAVNRAGTY